jgi:SAM-dependent methyltransferase
MTQTINENFGYCAACKCNMVDSKKSLYKATGFNDHNTYYLCSCDNCGVILTQPEPSIDDLNQAYSCDYYGDSKSKFTYLIERWTRLNALMCAKRILKQTNKPGQTLRILDIGCGRGNLLEAFACLGHKVAGVERAGSPFSSTSYPIYSDVTELNTQSASYDIIILWHALEHLSNPMVTLEVANKLLDRSGSLFISVPNFGSIQAQIFKNHWFHLDLPRHLFHFKYDSLNYLLRTLELNILRKSTFCFDQNTYGFIQSALNCLPGLSNNHLYDLLKTGKSKKLIIMLVIYFPLLIPLTILAIAELSVSVAIGRGATLTIQVVK